MAITSPLPVVDARGRAIPVPEAEIRARAAAIARGLEALEEIGDDEEQRATFAALRVDVDEDRLSDRRRFR